MVKIKILLQPIAIILIFFILLEIIARLFLHYHLVYDVEMSRYAVTLKEDSPDRHIGHMNRPNALARLMGVWVRTDSDGFRGPGYPVARSAKKRIMFLGDSLTFGWGVDEKDTFSSILESRLNAISPTEIINTGVNNYNVEQETYQFFQKGLKYHPDKVVLFYFIRDAEPTPQRPRLWFLGYSELITFYRSRIHILMVNSNPAQTYLSHYSSLYKAGQPGLVPTLKSFLLLRDTCRKNGIALQVILLPELHQLVNYPFIQEHRMMMDFLQSNGIDALDLAPYFSHYRTPIDLWVARDDAHPNKKAHLLFAQDAFDFIKKGLF